MDRTVTRMILAVAMLAAPVGALAACGHGSAGPAKRVTPTTAGASPSREGAQPGSADPDNDSDRAGAGRHDSDDDSILNFGHRPTATEGAQITTLVQRYYRAAAAQDGARACSMLYSIYAEAVPEDYGTSPPGPAYARGASCAAVLTAVFRHFHKQIATKLPRLEVARVRVKERQGVAVLSFGAIGERQMHIIREGSTWKMLALVDTDLP